MEVKSLEFTDTWFAIDKKDRQTHTLPFRGMQPQVQILLRQAAGCGNQGKNDERGSRKKYRSTGFFTIRFVQFHAVFRGRADTEHACIAGDRR